MMSSFLMNIDSHYTLRACMRCREVLTCRPLIRRMDGIWRSKQPNSCQVGSTWGSQESDYPSAKILQRLCIPDPATHDWDLRFFAPLTLLCRVLVQQGLHHWYLK